MPNTGALVSIVVGAAIAVLLFSPFTQTALGLGSATTVSDEIATADGASVELRGYQLTNTTVDVEAYNDTTDSWEPRTAGSDYTVDRQAGELELPDGSRIQDDDRVRVDYEYQPAGDRTARLLGVAPFILAVLILAIMAREL
jgi:hypothetical protein